MTSQTLLIVDDEETVLLPLTFLFRRDGYRVLTAASGEEALEQFAAERPAVIISDQRMPGLSGIEFLRAARDRWPDAVRILLTAFSDARTAVSAINDGHVYRYMTKPWDNDELRAVVRDSIRFYELSRENQRLYELTLSQTLQLRALNQALEQKVAARTAEIEIKNHELENNLLDVVRLLASVQELRSSSIGGVAQRMAQGARWLANAVGLAEAERYDIEIAATVHDIGKLGLPDRVLLKDTYNVSREDQEMIRQSPVLGETLLSTIPRLTAVARIVRHQHEWWNGNGFPDGLRGEAIPMGARIVAVVDGHVTTGERETLLRGSGHRYDPRLVQEYLRYLTERRETTRLGEERRIAPAELSEGMILTRDLYTGRGLLLATSGKVVDQPTLDKIRNFNRVDPIEGRVYVHA